MVIPHASTTGRTRQSLAGSGQPRRNACRIDASGTCIQRAIRLELRDSPLALVATKWAPLPAWSDSPGKWRIASWSESLPILPPLSLLT